MKRCKQCGRMRDDYRPYYPRSEKSKKVGVNTICKECEAFNAKVNRIYRSVDKTPAQLAQLEVAAKLYRVLDERGLEPKGGYARVILGTGNKSEKADILETYATALLSDDAVEVADIYVEYNAMLVMELVDVPDVYQDMLDELRQRSAEPNGKVKEEYAEVYNKVAKRIDDYEDSYEW